MTSVVKKIGIMTSGGDAPGMNAAVRAAVRTAAAMDIEIVGIRRGYQGLITGDFMSLTADDVSGIASRGGTILFTARSEEYKTREGVRRSADICRSAGIDGIVAIGGDGTFRGALELSQEGIAVSCIPATIDNDIAGTTYTIGFDTACNTAVEAIDRLRDTMKSHERCSVVEVMGRESGHIALAVGIACGAACILVPEEKYDLERDVLGRILKARRHGRTHLLVIVAEGAAKAQDVADKIVAEMGIETRVTVLGHVQRGGTPLCHDRIVGSRMGYTAVKMLAAGERDKMIGLDGGKYISTPLAEAMSMPKGLDSEISVILDVLTAYR